MFQREEMIKQWGVSRIANCTIANCGIANCGIANCGIANCGMQWTTVKIAVAE
jgi:hypothetical protein